MTASPTVAFLHIAPATKLPMRSVESVEAEAGKGLVGDRYHGTKHRHVTVQSAVALAAAQEQFGSPVEPGATRRNITLSEGDIPSTPGDRFTVAGVQLEVVRIAAPCKLLEDLIGRGAKDALRRRAGSVCRLLSSGTINVGDHADLSPTDDSHAEQSV